jgi:hypothetical protein
MSGEYYSRVSISRNEYERLRREARNATNLSSQVNALRRLEELNQRSSERYQNERRDMQRRLDQMNTNLTNTRNAARKETQQLRQQLEAAVRQGDQNLQRQAEEHQRQLANMNRTFHQEVTTLRNDVADTIQANNQRIQDAIRQNNQQLRSEMATLAQNVTTQMEGLQNQINAVESSVAAIHNDNVTMRAMAQEYAEVASQLLADVANYRADQFFPGRRAALSGQLATAQSDIAEAGKMPGASATARMSSRTALNEIMEFRQQVLLAEQEWTLHQQLAQQAVNEVLAQLEASRTMKLPEMTETLDVNHWSNGDLDRIQSRLDALDQALKDPNQSTADLDGLQAAALQLSNEIDETSVFAAAAYQASVHRVDLAGGIAGDLDDVIGLTVAGHGYQGDDQRAGYRVRLVNEATGFEMVITQVPSTEEDGTVSNQLDADILHYGTYDQATARQLAESVLSTLYEYGIEQAPLGVLPDGDSRCTSAQDRSARANLNAWRQETATTAANVTHTQTEADTTGTTSAKKPAAQAVRRSIH